MGGREKERGLTDGLGLKLGKSQEGGPGGELGLEFSGIQAQVAPTLGIHPQYFWHHGLGSFLSRS